MTVLQRSGPPPSKTSPSRSSLTGDHDLLSTASSALRRLHFKSTGGSRGKDKSPKIQQPPVPKVVIMGASTTSNSSTINTSIDSANTVATMITNTDGEDGSEQPQANYLDDYIGTSLSLDDEVTQIEMNPEAPPPTPIIGNSRRESKFVFVKSDDDTPTETFTVFETTATVHDGEKRGSIRRKVNGKVLGPDVFIEGVKMIVQDSVEVVDEDASGRTNSAKRGTTTAASSSASVISSGNGTATPVVNTTPNPLDGCGVTKLVNAKGTAIVVQQASVTGSTVATVLLKGDKAGVTLTPESRQQREDNMKQLLDVSNTYTLQELHDFEMRYGSPHHSRSQSVKTPGSRSNNGRPNYLCLPQQRSRVASMPNTGVEEEYYRQRHFSITGKGVVNRGDSLKSRRSRSNNSVGSSNSSHSTEMLTTGAVNGSVSHPGSARTSATTSLASSRESSTSAQGQLPYKVVMLGAAGVGKSSLISQFMTSEYLHAYDTSIDDEYGEKSVVVLLDGEESELTFIDHASAEMSPENCITTYEPQAYIIVYSTVDRASMRCAEHTLQCLWKSDSISSKAVILVGNKADLVRSRVVTTDEGKSMATAYDCKFIETSVGINHNVDELLVGILSQIRLKLENPERTRDLFRKRSCSRKRQNRNKSPLGTMNTNSGHKPYRGSRTSTSLKVKSLIGKVWARDSKSKSCENLHVL